VADITFNIASVKVATEFITGLMLFDNQYNVTIEVLDNAYTPTANDTKNYSNAFDITSAAYFNIGIVILLYAIGLPSLSHSDT